MVVGVEAAEMETTDVKAKMHEVAKVEVNATTKKLTTREERMTVVRKSNSVHVVAETLRWQEIKRLGEGTRNQWR